ncbi:MAG: hypothetical protein B9S33_02220 [Pedosphaera sp. Tous-C6FEB]|nr:MAG: hypothetical protein B9S33_02220 [Pedosphaera sp. Tous-C6FEB]
MFRPLTALSAFALAASLFALGSPRARAAAAPDAKHWAYQPVSAVQPPTDAIWSSHPIDRFIFAELKKRGLKPNPPADSRTLVRRLYFDLTGLPPTPEQAEEFERAAQSGNRQSAIAALVDKLLASPHYGERWGRHWLDAARYADTSGDGADAPVPEARLYRDYVIDAFNTDLPYDQFITEQIAGDLLVKREPAVRARERILATDFVAVTRRFNNGEYSDMHLVIENTLSTIGKGMLGMSIGCARCHDHKFDPISSEDYYGLYGYFASTQYPHAGTESGKVRKNFVPLPDGGIAWAVTDKKKADDIGDAFIQVKGEPKNTGDKAPRAFLSVLNKSTPQIPAGESGRLQLAQWIASADNPLTTRVVANRIWMHHFGKGIVETADTFGQQGRPPTHPELLDWLAGEFVRRGWSFKEMHRLILTSATWQQSSGNAELGMRNAESGTPRASAVPHSALRTPHSEDPENKLYWRFPRHRLDAESMRDASLFVSGRLKTGNPGAHPFPKPNEKNEYPYTQHRPFLADSSHEYRSVYLPSRRLGKHPYMELFDGPNPNECNARRPVSTVPLQALFWMNSDFIRDNARSLAARVVSASQQPEERIRRAHLLAYNRPPSADEFADLTAYAKDYAKSVDSKDAIEKDLRVWTSVCRLLLSANEFVYLD